MHLLQLKILKKILKMSNFHINFRLNNMIIFKGFLYYTDYGELFRIKLNNLTNGFIKPKVVANYPYNIKQLKVIEGILVIVTEKFIHWK